jgi:hypothetical protein
MYCILRNGKWLDIVFGVDHESSYCVQTSIDGYVNREKGPVNVTCQVTDDSSTECGEKGTGLHTYDHGYPKTKTCAARHITV